MELTCPKSFAATALTSFAAVWPLRACGGLIWCMDGSSLGQGLAGCSCTHCLLSQLGTSLSEHLR